MDIFIDCLVDEDLKGLIIEGTASEKELKDVWDKIYVQFCELSQSGQYNEAFEILKDIGDCEAKLTIVNNTVKHLSLCNEKNIDNDIELISILNTLALRSQIKPEDRGEILIKKLNSVVGRAKKWVERIAVLREKLEKIRSANSGKMDRVYFDECLEALSGERKYNILASEITVSRFCLSLNRLREKAERMDMENSKAS